MLTKQMKLVMILTAAMGTSALAQEATVVESPDGTTTIVPTDATTSSAPAPVTTVVMSDYPVFNQDMNDANIIETRSGFRGHLYSARGLTNDGDRQPGRRRDQAGL